MPDWSIKFIPAKNRQPDKLADFVLDVPGDPAGPFNVFNGDNVSWNNATQDDHWPAVYAAVSGGSPSGNPQPIGNSLKPRTSSDTYSVSAAAGFSIFFCCKLHAKEVGVLKVIAPSAPPTV